MGNGIYHLRDEKQKVQLNIIGQDELKKRIVNMSDVLQEQPTAITKYNGQLIRWLIEKVTIY